MIVKFVSFIYCSLLFSFSFQPGEQKIDNICLLAGGQFCIRRDVVPFVQALTAATGMLGDKNGMSAHRGLFAVIRDIVRSRALPNKTFGVAADGAQPLSAI
jgi:hypothetical protein